MAHFDCWVEGRRAACAVLLRGRHAVRDCNCEHCMLDGDNKKTVQQQVCNEWVLHWGPLGTHAQVAVDEPTCVYMLQSEGKHVHTGLLRAFPHCRAQHITDSSI